MELVGVMTWPTLIANAQSIQLPARHRREAIGDLIFFQENLAENLTEKEKANAALGRFIYLTC